MKKEKTAPSFKEIWTSMPSTFEQKRIVSRPKSVWSCAKTAREGAYVLDASRLYLIGRSAEGYIFFSSGSEGGMGMKNRRREANWERCDKHKHGTLQFTEYNKRK